MSSSAWISRERALNVTGWSPRQLQRKAKDGTVKVRYRRIGRGAPVPEYCVDSLPLPAQLKILEQRKSATTEASSALIPAAADEQLAALSPSAAGQKVALSPEEDKLARERLAIIESVIDFENEHRPAPRGQLPLDLDLVLQDGRKVLSASAMVEYLAHTHQRSGRTIWRWCKAFREEGLPGLARGARKDKGKSRFFEKHQKAAAVAASLYLDDHRRGMRGIHRLLCEQADVLEIAADDLPSYETVRDWLSNKRGQMRVGAFTITPAMRILAREGLRPYQNRCAPYITRQYVDVCANQIWCSDGKICDVEVWNDCFAEITYGVPLRLRFTGIQCFRSRKLVGWSFSPVESSLSIATAMRGALERFGPPEIFYVDNGKAFKKVGRGAEDGAASENTADHSCIETDGILAWLGIKPQYCLPYHGQSKPIERAWRTIKEQFEIECPAYTGGKPELRPDSTTVAMVRHRKLLKMGPAHLRHSEHLPASAFMALFAAYIDKYNNSPHGGEGMDNRTPNEVFASEIWPEQRPAPGPAELAMAMAKRDVRTVKECAVVLGGRRYIGDDELAAKALHDRAEQKVIIAYDPNDCSGLAVLDLHGCYLCWAKPEVKQPQSPAAADAVAAMIAQRKRLQNQTQDDIAQVRRLGGETGVRPALEVLAETARALPFAVGEHLSHRAVRIRPDDNAKAPATAADCAKKFLED